MQSYWKSLYFWFYFISFYANIWDSDIKSSWFEVVNAIYELYLETGYSTFILIYLIILPYLTQIYWYNINMLL